MKKLLVIAYSFPPCSVTGTYRTLAFVKHLDGAGWQSTVLSAANPIHPERDDALLTQIPERARVFRTRDADLIAWRDELRRKRRSKAKAGAGPAAARVGWHPLRTVKLALLRRMRPFNHTPGWYRGTLAAGRQLLGEQVFDAIYSSGPPWTAHEVASQLAAESGLPWVADFRDPWVSNPFAPNDAWLRARDERGEAIAMERASAAVCVLDTMRASLLSRYPARSPDSVVTIPNGFDPAGFADLRTGGAAEAGLPGSPLTIVHAGQIYGRRRIQPILSGIARWRALEPEVTRMVRLEMLGGDEAYVAELRSRAAAVAAREWMFAEPEVPHHEVLRRLARSTVLLLVGFSGAGEEFQMSGKIFEYLALRRPILALAPPACPVGDVLRAAQVRHWIVSPDDAEGIAKALHEIGEEWRQGKLAGPQSVSSLARFDRREQAKELAAVLDRVARVSPAGAR